MIKKKYVYSGCGITFDSAGWWSFNNDTATNVIILKLILTFGINGKFGLPEKKFSINFDKTNTKFCFSLHYNADNSYLFVNGKGILKIKGDNKNVNFPTQFSLGSTSNGVRATVSREVSLNGNVYDFSVDYNSIDNTDILNIHKYLMNKNNMKQCLALLNKCLLFY